MNWFRRKTRQEAPREERPLQETRPDVTSTPADAGSDPTTQRKRRRRGSRGGRNRRKPAGAAAATQPAAEDKPKPEAKKQPDRKPAPGVFDTWQQAVVFPETAERIVQVNASSRGMKAVAWALPVPGEKYRVAAATTGGGKLRFMLRDRAGGKLLYDSMELGNGEAATFVWPAQPVTPVVQAISGTGQPSSVRGTLVATGG